MRELNEFQNEDFEKDAMVVEHPNHEVEERPRVERPNHDDEERPIVERPKHEVEEIPRVERPKHEVEKKPRVGRLKHEVEGRPRSVEEKINFIINFSTDKTQLLELKKILVELEFYEKEERKEILENDERKIRRR